MAMKDARSVALVSVSLAGGEFMYVFVAVLHCNFNLSGPYTVVSLCPAFQQDLMLCLSS